MPDKILVTYASRAGSTVGVAEAIGQTLAEGGAQVDVRPMTEVKDVSPYRAVIAGSAIQDNAWLPEALQFMRQHRTALAQKPLAAFMVCMTMSMKNEKAREAAANWMQPVRAIVPPVREGYFAGALDLSKIPSLRKRMMFAISVRLGVWSEGDHRDWDEIRTWAAELKPVLGV